MACEYPFCYSLVNEFLMSTGYLPGAHHERCPIFERVAALRPAWMRAGRR